MWTTDVNDMLSDLLTNVSNSNTDRRSRSPPNRSKIRFSLVSAKVRTERGRRATNHTSQPSNQDKEPTSVSSDAGNGLLPTSVVIPTQNAHSTQDATEASAVVSIASTATQHEMDSVPQVAITSDQIVLATEETPVCGYISYGPETIPATSQPMSLPNGCVHLVPHAGAPANSIHDILLNGPGQRVDSTNTCAQGAVHGEQQELFDENGPSPNAQQVRSSHLANPCTQFSVEGSGQTFFQANGPVSMHQQEQHSHLTNPSTQLVVHGSEQSLFHENRMIQHIQYNDPTLTDQNRVQGMSAPTYKHAPQSAPDSPVSDSPATRRGAFSPPSLSDGFSPPSIRSSPEEHTITWNAVLPPQSNGRPKAGVLRVGSQSPCTFPALPAPLPAPVSPQMTAHARVQFRSSSPNAVQVHSNGNGISQGGATLVKFQAKMPAMPPLPLKTPTNADPEIPTYEFPLGAFMSAKNGKRARPLRPRIKQWPRRQILGGRAERGNSPTLPVACPLNDREIQSLLWLSRAPWRKYNNEELPEKWGATKKVNIKFEADDQIESDSDNPWA